MVFVLNIDTGHPQTVTKQSCVHSMQLHIIAVLEPTDMPATRLRGRRHLKTTHSIPIELLRLGV